jgi:hypothetical protein
VSLQRVQPKNPIEKNAMTHPSSPAINADAGKGAFISKVIGPKKRWWEYKARVRQLPENYRTAVDAIERNRLTSAIARAAGDDTGNEERAV